MRAARLAPCFLAALALALSGCDLPGKPDPDDKPEWPDQVKDFDKLFSHNCAGCHGADGQLGPAPPLNDPLFLAIVPEEELVKVVRAGRAGTSMPAFAQSEGGKLTDKQVEILARGLKSKWGTGDSHKNAPPYLARGKGSVEVGQEAFTRACARCHGEDGKGDREGAVNDPNFLALVSDQALRRLIITGRPDLGMPDYAGRPGGAAAFEPLTAEEVSGLVALLGEWRKKGSAKGN
jgi:cytochrome c oxidase cbb3-type subunit 3